MIRWWTLSASLAIVAFWPSTSSAQTRAYSGPTVVIAIDGGPAERVMRWAGGDPQGRLPQGAAPKQISGFAYAPIAVDVVIGTPTRFTAGGPDRIIPWVADFLAGHDTAHTVDLITLNNNNAVQSLSLHATNVHLTEVHLPALDATSNSGTMQLTLVMAPQRTDPLSAGTPLTSFIDMTGAPPSRFSFALSGTATQRTMSVEPIVIARSGSGALDISTIAENVPFIDAADTLAWRDDYVVQGHTSAQRSVVLDLLSTSGTSVFAVQFTQVGIRSAALNPQVDNGSQIAHVRVELFANGVSFLTPGTNTSSTGTTPPTQVGAATNISSATKTTPPGTAASTTASTGAGATASTGPTTSTGPTASTGATTPTTSTTNAGDQGARDPNDFPRVAGMTRTSFTGSREKTQSTEIGTYVSSASVDEMVEQYVSAAKGAGWQETNRYEEGDPGKRTHQVRLVFRKPQSTATITIIDNPQAGTNIRVLIVINYP